MLNHLSEGFKTGFYFSGFDFFSIVLLVFLTSNAIYGVEIYYIKSASAKISIVWAKANIDG
jgi:hypothetical protein